MRARLRANHREHGGRLHRLLLARHRVLQLNSFEPLLAHHSPDHGAAMDLDVALRFDAPRKVARHRARQPVAADDEQHLRRSLGEIHRRLAG